MRKVYLAIPYSKIDNELSYNIANEVTFYFLNMGYNVFSPITHSHPLTKYGIRGDWDFWEKIDTEFIDWANEIVVIIPPIKNPLLAIESSVGLQAEIKYGKKKGKKIRYFDYFTKKFIKENEVALLTN